MTGLKNLVVMEEDDKHTYAFQNRENDILKSNINSRKSGNFKLENSSGLVLQEPEHSPFDCLASDSVGTGAASGPLRLLRPRRLLHSKPYNRVNFNNFSRIQGTLGNEKGDSNRSVLASQGPSSNKSGGILSRVFDIVSWLVPNNWLSTSPSKNSEMMVEMSESQEFVNKIDFEKSYGKHIDAYRDLARFFNEQRFNGSRPLDIIQFKRICAVIKAHSSISPVVSDKFYIKPPHKFNRLHQIDEQSSHETFFPDKSNHYKNLLGYRPVETKILNESSNELMNTLDTNISSFSSSNPKGSLSIAPKVHLDDSIDDKKSDFPSENKSLPKISPISAKKSRIFSARFDDIDLDLSNSPMLLKKNAVDMMDLGDGSFRETRALLRSTSKKSPALSLGRAKLISEARQRISEQIKKNILSSVTTESVPSVSSKVPGTSSVTETSKFAFTLPKPSNNPDSQGFTNFTNPSALALNKESLEQKTSLSEKPVVPSFSISTAPKLNEKFSFGLHSEDDVAANRLQPATSTIADDGSALPGFRFSGLTTTTKSLEPNSINIDSKPSDIFTFKIESKSSKGPLITQESKTDINSTTGKRPDEGFSPANSFLKSNMSKGTSATMFEKPAEGFAFSINKAPLIKDLTDPNKSAESGISLKIDNKAVVTSAVENKPQTESITNQFGGMKNYDPAGSESKSLSSAGAFSFGSLNGSSTVNQSVENKSESTVKNNLTNSNEGATQKHTFSFGSFSSNPNPFEIGHGRQQPVQTDNSSLNMNSSAETGPLSVKESSELKNESFKSNFVFEKKNEPSPDGAALENKTNLEQMNTGSSAFGLDNPAKRSASSFGAFGGSNNINGNGFDSNFKFGASGTQSDQNSLVANQSTKTDKSLLVSDVKSAGSTDANSTDLKIDDKLSQTKSSGISFGFGGSQNPFGLTGADNKFGFGAVNQPFMNNVKGTNQLDVQSSSSLNGMSQSLEQSNLPTTSFTAPLGEGNKNLGFSFANAHQQPFGKLNTTGSGNQFSFGSNNQSAFGSSNQLPFGADGRLPFGSQNQLSFGTGNQAQIGTGIQLAFGTEIKPTFGAVSQASFGLNSQPTIDNGSQQSIGVGSSKLQLGFENSQLPFGVGSNPFSFGSEKPGTESKQLFGAVDLSTSGGVNKMPSGSIEHESAPMGMFSNAMTPIKIPTHFEFGSINNFTSSGATNVPNPSSNFSGTFSQDTAIGGVPATRKISQPATRRRR